MDEINTVDIDLFDFSSHDLEILGDELLLMDNFETLTRTTQEEETSSSSSNSLSLKGKGSAKRPSSSLVSKKDSQESCEESAKKKPKKQYYVKVNAVPRILKRDIRREYATMFANVHNSTDFNMIDSFFKYLCKPDCQIMKYKKLIPSTVATRNSCHNRQSIFKDEGKTVLFSASLAGFILHSYLVGNSFPDFAMKVKDVGISQTEGVTGSKLIIEAEFCGTKLDTYHSSIGMLGYPFVCPYCEQPELCGWSKKFNSIPTNNFLAQPSQVIFHLDEQHRAYKVEMIVLDEYFSSKVE